MSTMPSNQANLLPLDVELSDVLNMFRKNTFLNMNCHHVGTVQKFNASNQTATVTLNYTKTFFKLNNETNSYDPVQSDYPILADCPVVCLGGGTASLTFPIKIGDECLVIFNDRDMDIWLNQGSGYSPNSARLHSFADGIVLVGLRSYKNSIQNYDEVRAVLRNGTSAVGVRDDNGKVLITKDYPTNSTTLNSLLQQLITAIKAITVTPGTFSNGGGAVTGVSGTPVNIATLTSIATSIGNLLE